MKISACVIVKNEIKHLPQWLDCVRKLAEEIIVVDTGSTDGTIELAQEAGVRVYHFEWIKDFSAAKNYALDQATGEWIVFLDADEYFPPEDCPKVLSLIRRYHPDRRVGGFLCRLFDVDQDMGNRYISDLTVVRVFRNSRFLRFEGKIHEFLKSTAKRTQQMIFAEEIKIIHTGYSSSIVDSKLRRNLEILLTEQERRGEQPTDFFYLADCYYGLHDFEKAEYYARKTIDDKVQLLGRLNRPYLILIHCLVLLKRPITVVQDVIAEAKERFPAMPEFLFLAGICAVEEGNYILAERELSEGLALYRKMIKQSMSDMDVCDQATNLVPAVLWHLGKLAMLRGNREAALDYFTEGLRLDRYNDNLLKSVCQLLSSKTVDEAIEFLNRIYDKNVEAEFLAHKLVRTRLQSAVCIYYEREADKRLFNDFERHQYTGQVNAAAKDAMTEANVLVRLARLSRERVPERSIELNVLLPPDLVVTEEEERCRERLAKALSLNSQ